MPPRRQALRHFGLCDCLPLGQHIRALPVAVLSASGSARLTTRMQQRSKSLIWLSATAPDTARICWRRGSLAYHQFLPYGASGTPPPTHTMLVRAILPPLKGEVAKNLRFLTVGFLLQNQSLPQNPPDLAVARPPSLSGRARASRPFLPWGAPPTRTVWVRAVPPS